MPWEFAVLDALQKIHNPFLDAVMSFFSIIVDKGILWIAIAVILVIIPKTRRIGLIMGFSLLVDVLLCNVALKPIFNRPRPCQINTAIKLVIPAPFDASFPSGHAAASFAVTAAMFMAKKKKLAILFLVITLIVCFSRLYLYHHFPTDIIGGTAVGIIAGMLGYFIYSKTVDKKFHLQ